MQLSIVQKKGTYQYKKLKEETDAIALSEPAVLGRLDAEEDSEAPYSLQLLCDAPYHNKSS
jgi:hypothetical protein